MCPPEKIRQSSHLTHPYTLNSLWSVNRFCGSKLSISLVLSLLGRKDTYSTDRKGHSPDPHRQRFDILLTHPSTLLTGSCISDHIFILLTERSKPLDFLWQQTTLLVCPFTSLTEKSKSSDDLLQKATLLTHSYTSSIDSHSSNLPLNALDRKYAIALLTYENSQQEVVGHYLFVAANHPPDPPLCLLSREIMWPFPILPEQKHKDLYTHSYTLSTGRRHSLDQPLHTLNRHKQFSQHNYFSSTGTLGDSADSALTERTGSSLTFLVPSQQKDESIILLEEVSHWIATTGHSHLISTENTQFLTCVFTSITEISCHYLTHSCITSTARKSKLLDNLDFLLHKIIVLTQPCPQQEEDYGILKYLPFDPFNRDKLHATVESTSDPPLHCIHRDPSTLLTLAPSQQQVPTIALTQPNPVPPQQENALPKVHISNLSTETCKLSEDSIQQAILLTFLLILLIGERICKTHLATYLFLPHFNQYQHHHYILSGKKLAIPQNLQQVSLPASEIYSSDQIVFDKVLFAMLLGKGAIALHGSVAIVVLHMTPLNSD
ncbi:hypothetical protein K435DRAFT_802853 [Dendrothele bispora CBS 962.96]|uniref:Uncharacterized protein n=1 Tax=Dendrothele bispora (strain CBS 962.96) TaxID=1314807 RepID=A0A4V4HDZ4_DENBC|nr:hypothetical protein K435DRAFT_802853 [Dendrothele bispora CBS 962.96]